LGLNTRTIHATVTHRCCQKNDVTNDKLSHHQALNKINQSAYNEAERNTRHSPIRFKRFALKSRANNQEHNTIHIIIKTVVYDNTSHNMITPKT
jgi:hypothetical protein